MNQKEITGKPGWSESEDLLTKLLNFTQGSNFCSFYLKEEKVSLLHCLSSRLPWESKDNLPPVVGRNEMGSHWYVYSLLSAHSHSLHFRLRLETSCLSPPLTHARWRILTSSTLYVCLQLYIQNFPHKHSCLSGSGFFVGLHKVFSKDI